MSHVRTQIRERFRTVIAAAMPNHTVYASRKYMLNITDRPIVDMRFLNENISAETMGNDRLREASLYIRCQRAATETGIDDAMDADELLIFDAVEAATWADLLEEMPELVQVNFSDSAEAGYVVGALVLRYDVQYRVNKSDLETAKE